MVLFFGVGVLQCAELLLDVKFDEDLLGDVQANDPALNFLIQLPFNFYAQTPNPNKLPSLICSP